MVLPFTVLVLVLEDLEKLRPPRPELEEKVENLQKRQSMSSVKNSLEKINNAFHRLQGQRNKQQNLHHAITSGRQEQKGCGKGGWLKHATHIRGGATRVQQSSSIIASWKLNSPHKSLGHASKWNMHKSEPLASSELARLKTTASTQLHNDGSRLLGKGHMTCGLIIAIKL